MVIEIQMAQRIDVQDEQCLNVQSPDNEPDIIEIESLCMNCHEEVGHLQISLSTVADVCRVPQEYF